MNESKKKSKRIYRINPTLKDSLKGCKTKRLKVKGQRAESLSQMKPQHILYSHQPSPWSQRLRLLVKNIETDKFSQDDNEICGVLKSPEKRQRILNKFGRNLLGETQFTCFICVFHNKN